VRHSSTGSEGPDDELGDLAPRVLLLAGDQLHVADREGLEPARLHEVGARRESVGLSPVPALLVRTVDDSAAAAQAGVRAGDVLVRAGKRELRSAAALHAAIGDAAAAGQRLRLRVLRGTEEHQLTVPLADGGWVPAVTAGRTARAGHAV
jgi:hypothetical protein